jgi:hypothetical protein
MTKAATPRRPPRHAEGETVRIQVFVPGRLTSRLNGSASRAHWSVISRSAADWRDDTSVAWIVAGRPSWDGPAAVTFTAYVGALWDDDNLAAAIKPVRDKAVELILGTDDGPTCGHTFHYAQEVRPGKERGVLITVTPLEGTR